MSLALILLAPAAAKVATPPPAPLPDFEWAPMYAVAPPPLPVRGNRPVPVIEVTPDTVELTGAGTLHIEPDQSAFEALIDANRGRSDYAWLKLWFDPAGSLISCEGQSSWRGSHDADACKAVSKGAQFRFAPGFGQPLTRGFLRVDFDYARRMEPVLPIHFLPRESGTEVRMMVRPDGSCRVSSFELSDAARDALCRAIAADSRAQKLRQAVQEGNTGLYNLKLWLETKPLAAGERVSIRHRIQPQTIGYQVNYPPQTPQEKPVSAKFGTFALALVPEDLPKQAQFFSMLRPTTMLIGVTQEGQVQSCRPVTSSGTPMLDNTGCAWAAARGSFQIAHRTRFKGLRHVLHTIDWNALKPAPARP